MFPTYQISNTLNILDEYIVVPPLVVTVGTGSSTNTSSVFGSSLPTAEIMMVVHSFVEANGNSQCQVRLPGAVNRIPTQKYTKTHPCKFCGAGDLRKLTGFFWVW